MTNRSVIKFGSDDCEACKDSFYPFLELMSQHNLPYISLDVKDQEAIILFDVSKLPTFIVLDDDKEVYRCHKIDELTTFLQEK